MKKILLAAGIVLLIACISIAALLSQTASLWNVDQSKSFFNPLGKPNAQFYAREGIVEYGGKQVVFATPQTARLIDEIAKDPEFQKAVSSQAPVEVYQGAFGNAVVTSYSGEKLSSLLTEPSVKDALSGKTPAVPDLNPASPGDAQLLFANSSWGQPVPVLAPADMNNETFSLIQNTDGFQSALLESQQAQQPAITLYQDPLTRERLAIPADFSMSEVKALQSSQAVKQALASQTLPPGVPVDVSSTPSWSNIPVSALPRNPSTSLPLSFNPLQAVELSYKTWLLPIAASVILGLLYFFARRRSPAEPPAPSTRRTQARHITELQSEPGPGASRKKAWREDSRVISLDPLFTIRIVDNIIGEEGIVTISLQNQSGRKIERASIFSGSSETQIGSLEPGESKHVSLKPEIDKDGKHARLLLRFSPVVVQERAFSRFEFSLPVELL